MKHRFLLLVFSAMFLALAAPALAHEAYVLPASEFQPGLHVYSSNPFAPLIDPSHWKLFLLISALVAISYVLVLWWSTTNVSDRFDRLVKKAGVIGPLVIRLAVSASFFYSAMSNVILGPELPLAGLPVAGLFRFLLFLTSIMILTGTLTEIAAAIGIAMFIYVSHHFGWYLMTYTNYFGELLVLLLFGSRFLSVDRLVFGTKRWFQGLEKYKYLEVPIVRVLYGVALLYAGYTIKFAHQQLSIDVYNQYHLINFFHASAAFIASGAGLAELTIGLFVLLGFFMRWTVLISLVFITLSIFYFQELLWPHFILYGISFSLMINSGDKFTIDHYMVPFFKRL
ncbi:MAG TPA: DoxX family membrane protein, partial [Candidatus Paceibacterota bacterium]|nr:DoxX family membrane protein [Candidatus Paceibacterota bacterium]